MTADQLALFRVARPGPGLDRCYSLGGMQDAGWTGTGQFYYDARRWLAGDDLALTPTQVAYIERGEPLGRGRPA